jgi:hypothetical protein
MPRGVPKAGYRRTKNQKNGPVPGLSVPRLSPSFSLVTRETDDEIDAKLKTRFDIIDIMAKSACHGATRALIISGPAGLGKSFTVEKAVEAYDPAGKRSCLVKGFMRPTGLYKTLYNYRNPGDVLVFDDCDSIFFDVDALNLLKSACDTTDKRKICWGSETRMTDDEGSPLPWSFEFQGSIIFITNFDFDLAIETGGKSKEHFEAMISRAHYIDTGMKSMRDYLIRIRQVVDMGMLTDRGFDKYEQSEVMDYLFENAVNLRELTLRMVIKLASVYRSNPVRWREIAKVTLWKIKNS